MLYNNNSIFQNESNAIDLTFEHSGQDAFSNIFHSLMVEDIPFTSNSSIGSNLRSSVNSIMNYRILWTEYQSLNTTKTTSSNTFNQVLNSKINGFSNTRYFGITDWLNRWILRYREMNDYRENIKRSRNHTKRNKNWEDSDEDECSAQNEQSNILVLQGPCGCGKTSAVYDVAAKLGFNVIEVNASQSRNGTVIKKLISEAMQSKALELNHCGKREFNLILFDDVSQIILLIINVFINFV